MEKHSEMDESYLTPLIELHQCFDNLSNENYDENRNKILSSVYFNDPLKRKTFLQSFFIFISIRLSCLDNYAKLTQEIIEKNEDFKSWILNFPTDFKKYQNYGFYIRKCYDLGIYTLNEIKLVMNSQETQFANIYKMYFFNEINRRERDTLRQITRDFLQFKDYAQYGSKNGSIEQIFINDDIDKLQEICANGYSLDTTIDLLVYKKLTHLQAAALYGAVKCYKYLQLNGCKPEPVDLKLILSAIQGGNLEIMHYIEGIDTRFINKSTVVSHAIIFHRNDVLVWILDNMFEFTPTKETILVCIENFNPEMVLYFTEIYKENSIDFYNRAKELDYEEFIKFFEKSAILYI